MIDNSSHSRPTNPWFAYSSRPFVDYIWDEAEEDWVSYVVYPHSAQIEDKQ